MVIQHKYLFTEYECFIIGKFKKFINGIMISPFRYSKDEIERKVTTFRKMLMQKEGVSDKPVETDESGRPV